MGMKPQLTARLETRLSLTPELRQGLAMLQSPTIDMIADLQREAAENPVLDLSQPETPVYDDTTEVAQPDSLTLSLHNQIGLMQLDPDLAALARFLTGDISPDGYLRSSNAELAHVLNLPEQKIQGAIEVIQACDPVGVGARDLQECLTLQLVAKGIAADKARAVCAHLSLFATSDWAAASWATGIPQHEIESLNAVLKTTNPLPGAGFAQLSHNIIPEILVEQDNAGNLIVSANTDMLPTPQIDTTLLDHIEQDSKLAQEYYPRAKAMVRAYSFRSRTIARVAQAIVAHQHSFFTNGPSNMNPLSRAALATTLDLHPSTIGRTVQGKYLSFNGAHYPLDLFLTGALRTEDGAEVSAFAVQHQIRGLVSGESADAILSDQQIADILKAQGVDIARRTVAKYRGCMNIPSSFERRRSKATKQHRPDLPGSDPSNTT